MAFKLSCCPVITKLNCFYCSCSLEVAAAIVTILSILLDILSFISFLIIIFKANILDLIKFISTNYPLISSNDPSMYGMFITILIVMCLTSLISFIFNIMYLYGIHSRNENALLPSVLLDFIIICIFYAQVIFIQAMLINTQTIIVNLFYTLNILTISVFHLYMYNIRYNYYLYISESNAEMMESFM